MPALAGAGVQEHRPPAGGSGADIGAAVGAAPVVAAIDGDAGGDAVHPAQTALGVAVSLCATGRLPVECTGERAVGAVKAMTEGRGADVVIEAVGLPELWQLATRLLRRGGVVNFFGGCATGTEVNLDTQLLHYSEITCKASFHHTPALIRKALDVIGRGYVTAKDLVNGVEPLANLLEVMQHLMSHNGHLKTAIIP